MKSSLRILANLFIQSLLFTTAIGYRIDQSCAKEGIENDVRNAMISALEMVDAATNRLTATPLDQNTVDLLGKLFARPDQDPREGATAKTVDIFARIRENYGTEVPSGNDVGLEDIVSIVPLSGRRLTDNGNQTIFCNTDRFKLLDGPKKIYEDTSTSRQPFVVQ
jgi:hypothetical protein